MSKGNYELSSELISKLEGTPESGMNYRIVRVTTRDGKVYDNVVIVGGYKIAGIYGCESMPFAIADILDIQVTHLQKPPDFDQKKWFYIDKHK